MGNKREYEKILQIVNPADYPEEAEFVNKVARKYRILRDVMYILLFALLFYTLQRGKIIPFNWNVRFALSLAALLVAIVYCTQRKKLHFELNRYVFRECYPEKAVSRYLGMMKTSLHMEVIWSYMQYNLGISLFNHGEVDKAVKCLELLQESADTAVELFLAEHLKQKIALYYKDYNTAIACANEASSLFRKVKKNNWNLKVHNEMQLYAAYSANFVGQAYEQVYNVLQTPQERPLDEVARHYFLYVAAKELNDADTMEGCKNFIRANAGTTWYGQAIEESFTPVEKPVNYPGFTPSSERINKPKAISKVRIKYLIVAVFVILVFYMIPELLH